ncbi:hypothetical protein LCGC14_2552980 [marine sediment metagenome]|uniref:D-isomer specific 2-hydroxyacid dehydrogenase catalytic domain-containing protein n=1 Tax=marine sediment metagenome TaxID=412755 RepID=A0A0F9AN00_9ZZZZ
MKVLHILRTEPDESVKKFMEIISAKEESKVTRLYTGDVDWSGLADDILAFDKVISWW